MHAHDNGWSLWKLIACAQYMSLQFILVICFLLYICSFCSSASCLLSSVNRVNHLHILWMCIVDHHSLNSCYPVESILNNFEFLKNALCLHRPTMGMNQSSHNDQNKDLQVVTVDSNGRSLSASSGVDSGHNGKIKGITRLLTVENQKRQQKQDDSQLNKVNAYISTSMQHYLRFLTDSPWVFTFFFLIL